MTKWERLPAALATAFGLLLGPTATFCSAGPPANSTENVWVLKQRHGSLKRIEVFIGKQAVQIKGRDYSWGVACRAPSWDATCYSRIDKTDALVPYSRWSKIGFAGLESSYEWDQPPTNCPPRKTNYNGLSALVKQWNGAPPRMIMMTQERMGGKECFYTLISATSIDTAPQVSLLIRQFLSLPDIEGVPLKFTGSTELQNPMLSTQEIKRQTMGSEIFNPPGGLKRLKSSHEVFYSDQDKKQINELGKIMESP
ncbi:MAG: hypothetical protein JST01_16015 [Cyanobacteria bacterium SZAS TMP-1]|nr:hypothetical protein [Cyanobacteria bacterium SZAS TMP-1]